MDIRNWGLGQIMQLPDSCFGRRWLVITSRDIGTDATDEWLVNQPLPDRLVLWHISVGGLIPVAVRSWFKFALGDHEPANDAEFDAFQRLFPGDLDNTIEEGAILLGNIKPGELRCRMPLDVAGRRFAVQVNNKHESAIMHLRIAFTISSIPTEAPDWLVSR